MVWWFGGLVVWWSDGLVVGGWWLVVGCWLLVVGCWLLVVGCRLLVVGCFHSRLTGSLVSGEGALKRLKLAVPMHRLRVYPRENPQPRKHRGSNNAVAQQKQTGVPPGVWGHAPPRRVGPGPENKVAGTETNSRDIFDHGSRKNLHHFHDFFHNRGTTAATRNVTTLDHGRKAVLHTVHDLFNNQKTGWRDSTKNCENGTVH